MRGLLGLRSLLHRVEYGVRWLFQCTHQTNELIQRHALFPIKKGRAVAAEWKRGDFGCKVAKRASQPFGFHPENSPRIAPNTFPSMLSLIHI